MHNQLELKYDASNVRIHEITFAHLHELKAPVFPRSVLQNYRLKKPPGVVWNHQAFVYEPGIHPSRHLLVYEDAHKNQYKKSLLNYSSHHTLQKIELGGAKYLFLFFQLRLFRIMNE